MIKAEIQGTDSILKELDAIGKSIESGEVQKILRQSGQALVASARNMAPHRTGTLRKSIGFINKNCSKIAGAANAVRLNSWIWPCRLTEPRSKKT
jgi:hypothetical protein